MRLFAIREGEEHEVAVLGPGVVHLGRAPDNHLVLGDPRVSAHHASLWLEDGQAWIRDLGSRNGTWIDGVRVRLVPLFDGARLRVGSTTFVARGDVGAIAPVRTWLVEDLDAGIRYPFHGGRLLLGPTPHAGVRVEGDEVVSLHVGGDGLVWREGRRGEATPCGGEVFRVGDRRFRVVPASTEPGETTDHGPVGPDYRLEVTLDGVAGPEAVLIDPATARRHVVEAETRATLLYVLGRAVLAHRAGAASSGWCADEDVVVGVWGRLAGEPNVLHVLVHRLRKELRTAGFDPSFLQKRRKAIRLALRDVVVR